MKVKFTDLRDAFPYDPPARTELMPCKKTDGSPGFDNQCAIRVGIALTKTKVLPSAGAAGVTQCWFGHPGEGHTLRAEELAKYLSGIGGFGPPTKFAGKAPKPGTDAKAAMTGRQGVIFIKDFWGAGNSGDHIDIWSKDGMLTGSLDYLPRAGQVWFWELP